MPALFKRYGKRSENISQAAGFGEGSDLGFFFILGS
jgi:hypothetical protein